MRSSLKGQDRAGEVEIREMSFGIRVLFALGFALGAWTTVTLAADEGPYTVAKLAVDVTAKDAVAAKAKAIAEAEERALKIVLRRLVPFSAMAQIPDLEPRDTEPLVKGLSIRSEKYSTTRYIASLDVSLNPPAVKQLLAGRGIPISEDRAPSIAILPLVIEGDKVKSAGENWRQAWLDLDLANGMTPATLLQPRPGLDTGLVRAILAGDPGAYASLKGTYSDQPLIVAVGQKADAGRFTTRLAGADSVGRINFGRTDVLTGGDAKLAARDAAAFALAILESRWKVMQTSAARLEPARLKEGAPATDAPQAEPERNVEALVEFAGLKEWQDIRARLMQVPGLQALEVNSLSARMAAITFGYAGSLGRLQKVLGESGFSFENGEENFVIRVR
jgi:Uncharacterized protein conserved in bacteria (DUF2066)